MNYPYTLKTGALKDLLKKISKAGVPEKFSQEYLKTIGFTSSNDRRMLGVLKFIGFLDEGGHPTQMYKDYRGAKGEIVLGKAVQKGYSDLFNIYPDAQNKDDETLRHFFAGKSGAGEQVLKAMVATFKALCSMSDFEHIEVVEDETEGKGTGTHPSKVVPSVQKGGSSAPTININVELQVPESSDPAVYESFFKAMKKHLLDDE